MNPAENAASKPLWNENRDFQCGSIVPYTALNAVGMVVTEGLASLQSMVEAIDDLEKLRPDGDADEARNEPDRTGGTMVSDARVFRLTKVVCDTYALASLTLFERKRLGNSADRKAREERALELDNILAGVESGVFRDRRLRDRMAHTDEWIPRLIRQFPNSTWISNLGLSNRRMFKSAPDKPIIYSRTYIFDEGRILHLQQELDVRRLREVAMQIIERFAAPSDSQSD